MSRAKAMVYSGSMCECPTETTKEKQGGNPGFVKHLSSVLPAIQPPMANPHPKQDPENHGYSSNPVEWTDAPPQALFRTT